jgi:hypothetical protein
VRFGDDKEVGFQEVAAIRSPRWTAAPGCGRSINWDGITMRVDVLS